MESSGWLSDGTAGQENMKDLSAQSNPLNQQFEHEQIAGRVSVRCYKMKVDLRVESWDRENILQIIISRELKHSDQMELGVNQALCYVRSEHNSSHGLHSL